jgi:hypothetical protein
LSDEKEKLKREKAFKELAELLTEEDLKTIAASIREFRENFCLRTFESQGTENKNNQKASGEPSVV